MTQFILAEAPFLLKAEQSAGVAIVKIAIGILTLVLISLQQQIWFGQSGYFERKALDARQLEQQQRTDALSLRNAKMTAEVLALKHDSAAFESRARSELGMVREGEVFYLIPEAQQP